MRPTGAKISARSTIPTTRVKKVKKPIKIKKHFPRWSLAFTIVAVICWIMFIYQIWFFLNALGQFQSGELTAEMEGLLQQLIGTLTMPAIIAQFLSVAIIWGGLGALFTILLIIGWSRGW